VDVEDDTGPEDAIDAEDARAVRIVFGLALGVVLAMDRGPLLRDHAGREPQPEAEEVADDRMQVQGAVRLAAVEIDRDGGDRDLDEDQEGEQIAPPGEVQVAAKHGFCGRLWR
jgi:hypothetical protein